jgi:hypothetical protein
LLDLIEERRRTYMSHLEVLKNSYSAFRDGLSIDLFERVAL